MSRMVENNELDTINYQFYLIRSETMCMVHQAYTNSDSTLTHINAVASKAILPKILDIAKINRLDVYGNPSEELQKILTSFDSQIFDLFLWIQSLNLIISLGLHKVTVFYINEYIYFRYITG